MATQIRANTQIIPATIENAQIALDAAIATTKLAEGPLFIQSGGGVAWGADQSMGSSYKITNMLDGSNATDGVTKGQLDAVSASLDLKASVRAATTVTGTLATAFANASVIDGVTLATNDRILIKNQSTASENGIYDVQASGAPVRSSDADGTPASEVTSGMFTFVEEGTTLADSGWALITDGAINVGTTALSFTQFSGAGAIIAGAGLLRTGNTLDVIVGNGIQISGDSVAVQLDGSTLKVGVAGVALADLTDGQILVGNASDVAIGVTLAGDITIDNAGVAAISTGVIVDADINASAAITTDKLADGAEFELRNGTIAWTGAHNAGGNKLINLDDGTLTGDAVNFGQLELKLDDSQLITDNTLATALDTEIASALAVKTYVTNEISGALNSFVDGETPSGTVNGVTTVFTVATAPSTAPSLHVYKNGLRQTLGDDYTFATTSITFTVAPTTGAIIRVDYR